MEQKIPTATIGLLSKILPKYYSHSRINILFMSASAPDNVPNGSREDKVLLWLKAINRECSHPITILGRILEDFMDKVFINLNENENCNLKTEKETLLKTLSKDGFFYSRGGHLTTGGTIPAISLQNLVKEKGLQAVDNEIKRALSNIEADPMAAAHNAGCLLEAVFKAYLDNHKVEYKDDVDLFSDLWKKVISHIGIRPKEMDDKDLKKIASGLYNIVDGTMHLRNKKSASHGQSETQLQQTRIRPRHARLAIHSVYGLSAYILELLKVEEI